MPAAAPLSLFAITAPGLEPLTAAELRALGDEGARVEAGGVAWEGSLESLYRANLWLRTASRVVARLGEEFRATSFAELEKRARRLPWERFVAAGRPVRFRVTCRKSRLYHSDAVAERFAAAVERAVPGARAASSGAAREAADGEGEEREGEDAQLVVVRFLRDRCTVSVDASGALLHRRGYRQAVARAPLRETLAAALLLAAGWDGTTSLLDPMCGSGTIPIEGALIARRLAPGRHRRFAFMHWPGFDAALWARLVARADADALPASPVAIQGSDRDAGAIAAAAANAERAGVAADLELRVRALSAIEPPSGPGLVAANPPYGVRVGEADALRNLYAQLGHVLRARCPGWTLALLSPDRRLEGQLALDLAERLRTSNGGIPVRVVTGAVPGRPA